MTEKIRKGFPNTVLTLSLEEVNSLLVELNNEWISRENELAMITIRKMQNFIKDNELAK